MADARETGYTTPRPPLLFGRRRWLLDHENRRLRLAIGEVMGFVTSELDPDPHPWEAYATSREAQWQLRVEQRVATTNKTSYQDPPRV